MKKMVWLKAVALAVTVVVTVCGHSSRTGGGKRH